MNILHGSLLSLLISQGMKIFTSYPIRITRILQSGGLPSSHAAFVSTLSTLIGLEHGFNSDLFAVVVVFSLIIIYDATGVRRAVGKQANVLNNMIGHLNLKNIDSEKEYIKEELKELIGHTPMEVVIGSLLGILIGLLFWYK